MPEKYIVQQGECLSSIAFEKGFLWETIWNHSENQRLKSERKDPNVLQPGDELFIPDKDLKKFSKPTEAEHVFRRKGTPAKFRLRILEQVVEEPPQQQASAPSGNDRGSSLNPVYEDDSPRDLRIIERPCANTPFILIIDGSLQRGRTDGEGMLQFWIPPNSGSGRLMLNPGTPREREIRLNLGHLNPLTEVSGIKHRLRNLGFDAGEIDDEETPRLREALERFQTRHGLRPTGEADDATRRKIEEIHGS